ncbi:MAG: response regulator transcription factor [Parasphingorhabdus sp.]
MIDDHRLFLTGFTLIMEQKEKPFEVTPFERPMELLRAIEAESTFDLIICDLVMPSMNGLAFAQALRDHSAIPIMILSGINTRPPLAEMKRIGVNGFVHKSVDDNILMDSIEQLLSGKDCFPADESEDANGNILYFGDVPRPDNMDGAPALTTRQIEVLKLISEGASNAEISAALDISENTVKSHLRQIFDLLKVNKRTASVRVGQALGLI